MSICGTSASAHPSAFVAAGDTGVRGLSLQRIRACAGGCIYTVASVFMQNGQSHIRINAILVVYEFLSILRSGQRSHNQTVWVTVAETQLGVTAAHVFFDQRLCPVLFVVPHSLLLFRLSPKRPRLLWILRPLQPPELSRLQMPQE